MIGLSDERLGIVDGSTIESGDRWRKLLRSIDNIGVVCEIVDVIAAKQPCEQKDEGGISWISTVDIDISVCTAHRFPEKDEMFGRLEDVLPWVEGIGSVKGDAITVFGFRLAVVANDDVDVEIVTQGFAQQVDLAFRATSSVAVFGIEIAIDMRSDETNASRHGCSVGVLGYKIAIHLFLSTTV